ncbi:MAG TPA: adenosylcobalamin-dependent ribonucleoside-diphosphate reductase [Phycisphaerae bacterium]|nr:adenosylcobalamin-dependent ribonucleoside-diphosphate reductase [Phycisphaerae bacterium]HRS27366.1 adenosylcobalamin-dependent ribonucleoside-diphosphate reductase [Phycisphaerae bacterium]
MSQKEAADLRLTEEPLLTPNARTVLEARYLKKNEAGECIETPGQLFRRVARTIANIEPAYGADETERQTWEQRFYDLMASGKFMPNSPTLMNAGRELGLLSACFVLPVHDSIVDIFDAIKQTALIQKAGGGTGFAFDELRPTGDYIKSSGGTTSGPITFWRAFSEATNAIQQGAFRRGANMGMMYIHHPDILKFLYAKQDLNQFTNYNISVKVTDTWMEEFRADPDSPHIVRNPRTGRAYAIPRAVDIWKHDLRDLVEIHCVEPASGRAAYYTTPRLTSPLPEELQGHIYTKHDIWTIITQHAWQTGEPGIVFIDRINQHNPTPHVGRIEATNPCGEQPLLPHEACNLGSLNLGRFVRNACTPQAEVDWEAMRQAVRDSVRFLDNVIDANTYPLPEIEKMCKANRKIGLGIMGFADALFALNVPYNSALGVSWGERFMKFINEEAHLCSEELARTRGCFPNWQGSIWQTRYDRPMRNAAVTTVAPTGTISIIANCSGGVEPLFSLAFIRNVLRGQKQGEKPLVEVNALFRRVAQERGFLSDELLERLAAEGTLARIPKVPEDVRRVFVCAHDISPEWHMRMQAAFQQHCDSSISKTINFPRSATVADVERIYHLAYELDCKGVTVYRDGCRAGQPMALKNGEGEKAHADASEGASAPPSDSAASRPVREQAQCEACPEGTPPSVEPTNRPGGPPTRPYIEPADLPEIVSGFRIRQMTPFGNMHVKITVDPHSQRELEIFAQLGKGGDVANSDLEGLCRIASLWLRAGGSLVNLIKQWEGIGSSLQIPTRAGRIMSLPDGLACALKKYLRAKERFGLRALLLGEIDPAELDNPYPPPHERAAHAPDRTVDATRPQQAPLPPKRGQDPSAGGGADSKSYATGAVQRRLDGGNVARLDSATEPKASAHSSSPTAGSKPSVKSDGNGHGKGNGKGNGGTVVTTTSLGNGDSAWSGYRPPYATRSDSATALAVEEAAGVAVVAEPQPQQRAASAAGHSEGMSAVERAMLASILSGGRHDHDAASHYALKCPMCGGPVARQEGCLHCGNQCGWAAC